MVIFHSYVNVYQRVILKYMNMWVLKYEHVGFEMEIGCMLRLGS